MLHVWKTQDKNHTREWLEKLFHSKQTWLLSDLRTKFEIQEIFLDKKGFFLEESVLRASDLWKKILLRSHPEYKVLTPQATRLHLRFFLKHFGEALGLPESSEKTLLKWMTDLAVIYFHPNGEERLVDWFDQNPDQQESWKDWWLRAKAAFSYFESKKQLMAAWIPAFLQRAGDISPFWERDLFVDLGGQLSFVEAELLQQISKTQEVIVVSPELKSDVAKYKDLLQPYDYLKGFSENNKSIHPFEAGYGVHFDSFSSILGSIRQATAQVRKWIESGISSDRIAIVSPDIESIWPVLVFHLETEGLPIKKAKVSSLQATVPVQYFLSKIRTLNRSLSTRDLELSYYGLSNENPELDFSRFESLYKNIYDESDYGRYDKIAKNLKLDWDLKKSMGPMQFIYYLSQIQISHQKEEIPSWLEVLVRDVLSSFDESFQLPWTDWVAFCEISLSRHEVSEKEGDVDGVLVTNLMSAHFLTATHRIFLDLSEESLKTKSDQGIMPQSARKMAGDLGFWLNHGERSDLEFELEWAVQCGRGVDHLYFAANHLNGQILTPSSVWLKLKNSAEEKKAESFRVPDKTVLDFSLQQKELIPTRLLQDLGEKTLENLPNVNPKVLSPSSLEAFFKCPFIFYARQTLKLKTFPEIDLDLDRRLTGEALHFLFETILNQGLSDWNEERLSELLDAARATHFSAILESFWPAQKKKMIRICQRFIQFEAEWSKQHPETKKRSTEVNWKGTIDDVLVRGRIDRVDESKSGKLVVLDYKLSGSTQKGAHQWIENGSLQMLFYMQALEKGWADGIEGEVVAAFYYVVKNFARETGFEMDQEVTGFFENTKKRSQKFNEEKKQDLLKEFDSLISSLIERIKQGDIKNQPADEATCVTCDWKRLCRAPHLS